jgi:tellurite resistance protein
LRLRTLTRKPASQATASRLIFEGTFVTTSSPAPSSQSQLSHLPVSLFAIVMGLAGTTIAVQKAEHLWDWAVKPGQLLMLLTALVYVLIAGAYLGKFILHRAHVVAEFNHPIRMSFFPAMSIGMILLSVPMAALTIATMVMLEKVGGAVFAALASALLVLLGALIVMLPFNTGRTIMRGEICVRE